MFRGRGERRETSGEETRKGSTVLQAHVPTARSSKLHQAQVGRKGTISAPSSDQRHTGQGLQRRCRPPRDRVAATVQAGHLGLDLRRYPGLSPGTLKIPPRRPSHLGPTPFLIEGQQLGSNQGQTPPQPILKKQTYEVRLEGRREETESNTHPSIQVITVT